MNDRDGDLAEEVTWQAVVLIPKGKGDYRGIGLVEVMWKVVAVFQAGGYVTERRGEDFVGFIHSTGHGLGLEVHESPRVSPTAGRLRAGHVITIEPGLYYPGIGACRIEDVVRVTKIGSEMLSACHHRWVLK